MLFNPLPFVLVDCFRSVLMMRLTERDHIKVACFGLPIPITDDVMGIAGPRLSADHAGKILDARYMRQGLLCVALGLWCFQPERSFAC